MDGAQPRAQETTWLGSAEVMQYSVVSIDV
jgi:hypothetical protein